MTIQREYLIFQLRGFFDENIENTMNDIRKKQSRNVNELGHEAINEMEVEKIDLDEEISNPITNPKNVPIGWDGKPIPYWLYKLHQLGQEYKCEICGGTSYWGRKAFERHFQEWKHAYGMKCLKIPNTVHFKEVTGIEEALQCKSIKLVHKKLIESSKETKFRPEVEEEFEDNEGNVVNKKMFIDMKRQGLI